MDNHIIGKFCSIAKKGTMILPKNIPGYIAPKGQVLEEDGQKIEFEYTPINYNINYNIGNNAEMPESYKTTYTVEDEDYIPGSPSRDGYKFNGWEPKKIEKGQIGDVTFTAAWIDNPILLPGNKLNKMLDKMANGKQNIIAIQIYSKDPGPGDYYNLSCTNTKILAWFDQGIVYMYSKDQIYFNIDMSGAFEGMTILRDISCFSNIICKEGTNINSIFKNDNMLSDVQSTELWANSGNFSDFSDAFLCTSAADAGRVPQWYKWNVTFKYVSTTGIPLYIITKDVIPNQTVYAMNIEGYSVGVDHLEITDPNKVYMFIYIPKEYDISYILNGSELINPKTKYTVEDEDYYPAIPVKSGSEFDYWEPECINTGDTGNVVFVAFFK